MEKNGDFLNEHRNRVIGNRRDNIIRDCMARDYRARDYKARNYSSLDYTEQDILQSKKNIVEDFSVYDIVDYAYDLVYKIPDAIDTVAVGFDGYESCCDKYDYAMAAFAGLISGLIDAFFVNMPGDSRLGGVVDKVMDDIVIKFAGLVSMFDKSNTKKSKPDTIASAIGYLERRFKVNYDARFSKELKGGEVLENFNSFNHHLMSLAHCPDIVGLFFSILDQFTGKTTVVNKGKIYRLENNDSGFEIKGNNFVSKIVCGVVNWFGHLMSDMCGSSGRRGHEGTRGMGIPIPGFELFQFIGRNSEREIKGLADLTEKMFINGYDMRFGVAMCIPVFINEIVVKLMWALRERFQYNREWGEIIAMLKYDKRYIRMNLVSTGCFTLADMGDAAIRSKGNALLFALRVNYIGICKFAFAGYKEFMSRARNFSEQQLENILDKEWKMCFGSK